MSWGERSCEKPCRSSACSFETCDVNCHGYKWDGKTKPDSKLNIGESVKSAEKAIRKSKLDDFKINKPNGISDEEGRLHAVGYNVVQGNKDLKAMSSTKRQQWIQGFANGVYFYKDNEDYINRGVFNENSNQCSGDGVHSKEENREDTGEEPNHGVIGPSSE